MRVDVMRLTRARILASSYARALLRDSYRNSLPPSLLRPFSTAFREKEGKRDARRVSRGGVAPLRFSLA